MSMLTHHFLLDHIQFTLIHGPNIPGSYAILFFKAMDITFTTRYIRNWALFPLWLSLFIPFGAISLLFSSSILDTYRPGGLVFQCHIFCLFILFMGFPRILKWFAILLSSGPHFVRTLHCDPSVLGSSTWHGS